MKPDGDDVKPVKPDTPVDPAAEDGGNAKPDGDEPNTKPVKPEELDNKPPSNKQPQDKKQVDETTVDGTAAVGTEEVSQESATQPVASGANKVKPGSPDQVKPVVTSARKNKK